LYPPKKRSPFKEVSKLLALVLFVFKNKIDFFDTEKYSVYLHSFIYCCISLSNGGAKRLSIGLATFFFTDLAFFVSFHGFSLLIAKWFYKVFMLFAVYNALVAVAVQRAFAFA